VRVVITSNASQVSKRYKALLKKIPDAQEKALSRLADEAIALHKKTTGTWRHKPKFYKVRTKRGISVATKSDIYKWVDRGTKPHIIRARNAKFLAFRYPYKAATKPRVIASYRATVGKNWARKFEVHHPGTKPRNFTDEIVKRIQKRAANVMREEINKVINAEGFGL
jgi:hypothetical protein